MHPLKTINNKQTQADIGGGLPIGGIAHLTNKLEKELYETQTSKDINRFLDAVIDLIMSSTGAIPPEYKEVKEAIDNKSVASFFLFNCIRCKKSIKLFYIDR